jgi:hypothetical protein
MLYTSVYDSFGNWHPLPLIVSELSHNAAKTLDLKCPHLVYLVVPSKV